MCGRFTLATPARELARHFGLAEIPPLEPRYNVAPSQPVAVIRHSVGGEGRILEMRQWGLVPGWATDPRIASRLINARAETAARRPAFRSALALRRCLVPADGFYEWQPRGRRKQPYLVRVGERAPFGIAGLWDHWEGPNGETLETCTLLTTEANARLRPIHDRMPVILDPDLYAVWLDPRVRDLSRLTALLRPSPPARTWLHPVGPRVNDPRNDDPGLVEPAAEPLAGPMETPG